MKRLDPDEGAERLINLMTAWKREIMEMMGGMGINSIEALRGNRLMLRGRGPDGEGTVYSGRGPRRRMRAENRGKFLVLYIVKTPGGVL